MATKHVRKIIQNGKVLHMNSIDLKSLGLEWLELKKQRMRNLLKIAEPDEALYREIMLSLGYPKNKNNFLELSLLTPYSEIKRLATKELIEKALLYRGGFIDDKTSIPSFFDFSLRMSRSIWKYGGIRPSNFPEKRIKGITHLLSETVSKGIVNYFIEKINQQIENKNPIFALKKIMDFEGVGIQRKEEMFFNIIMPFIMVFSNDPKLNNFLHFIFENYPPLKENKLTKDFKANYPLLEIKTLKEYFGVLLFQKKHKIIEK
ncbi:MAG: hypothetical protein PWQ25_2042 [Deferribacteres bacterium]|jgi:hypothetical protein|nr:hypothetical protein [Deferribacteres bacterium]